MADAATAKTTNLATDKGGQWGYANGDSQISHFKPYLPVHGSPIPQLAPKGRHNLAPEPAMRNAVGAMRPALDGDVHRSGGPVVLDRPRAQAGPSPP